MNINIQREIDYTSKLFPDVKMKLRNLSTSEYKKSVEYHPVSKNNKKAYLEYDTDFMFKCMVSDISNLTVTDENKEVVEIKTGQDVLDNPGLKDLYLEVTPILIKMEARVDPKN